MDTHYPDSERDRTAFRDVRRLVGCYVALSVLTLGAIVLLRDDADVVTDAVWVRAVIVAASSLVTLGCVARAGHGSRNAFRRLRLLSAAMLVAIVVIAALPGAFPVWMRIEQGCCGLLLLPVVVLVNGRRLRGVFASS